MSFTNFIKRPVLSTVVSIFFVLLGIIGLVSLPIEPVSYTHLRAHET